MYSVEALYEILGWVIIVLTTISAIALIVCMRDRIKWKREQNTRYIVESTDGVHKVQVKTKEEAIRLWDQMYDLYPQHRFNIRKL